MDADRTVAKQYGPLKEKEECIQRSVVTINQERNLVFLKHSMPSNAELINALTSR